jgi:hypothetical protein
MLLHHAQIIARFLALAAIFHQAIAKLQARVVPAYPLFAPWVSPWLFTLQSSIGPTSGTVPRSIKFSADKMRELCHM